MIRQVSATKTSRELFATLGHVAPFLAYVSLLALEHAFGWPAAIAYPIRVLATFLILLMFSRPYLKFRPSAPAASIVIGMVVFGIWVAPDLLFGYRHFWLFENSITGSPASSLPPALHSDISFLAVRIIGSTLLVPIIEELFWRAWLMRWLVDKHFLEIPLGTYVPSAFWLTAVLFASEHGAYWEVGLPAGIVYNWWIVRTRTVADCILAHAVTNGILAAYVLIAGQWQYWL